MIRPDASTAPAAGPSSEEHFNQQFRTELARKQGTTIRGLTDQALESVAAQYRQLLERIPGQPGRRRHLQRHLRDVEREQEFRQALAEAWRATEDGTHCYTSFAARGGLAAVVAGDAPPPSYALAVLLDWEQYRNGALHVLDWPRSNRRPLDRPAQPAGTPVAIDTRQAAITADPDGHDDAVHGVVVHADRMYDLAGAPGVDLDRAGDADGDGDGDGDGDEQ